MLHPGNDRLLCIFSNGLGVKYDLVYICDILCVGGKDEYSCMAALCIPSLFQERATASIK